MKKKRFSLLVSLFALLAGTALAQSGSFSDPNVEYTFDLPDERWKMTAKPSATNPNVEYVFVDRNDGHLEIRKLTVSRDSIWTDIMRDEEQKLLLRPTFVAGKDEKFSGVLSGNIYNFEFARAGRPMAGRYYFLKVDPTTYYVLRFTGFRDKLRSLRNQTDSIARTFSIRKN